MLSSILSSAGSIGGGILNNMGSSSANRRSKNATLASALALNQGYNDISNMFAPYRDAGLQGFNNYVNTLNGDMGAYNASPYGTAMNQYVLDNTINQLEGSAAARGNLLSGNTLKSLQENIQDIQTNDYLNRLNQYLGRSMDLGNVGIGLTESLAGYRNNLANSLSGGAISAGDNSANAKLNQYRGFNNMFNGALSLGNTFFG